MGIRLDRIIIPEFAEQNPIAVLQTAGKSVCEDASFMYPISQY